MGRKRFTHCTFNVPSLSYLHSSSTIPTTKKIEETSVDVTISRNIGHSPINTILYITYVLFNAAQPGVGRVQVLGSKKVQSSARILSPSLLSGY